MNTWQRESQLYLLPAINAKSKYIQFQVPLKPMSGQEKKIIANMGNTWHSFFEKKVSSGLQPGGEAICHKKKRWWQLSRTETCQLNLGSIEFQTPIPANSCNNQRFSKRLVSNYGWSNKGFPP